MMESAEIPTLCGGLKQSTELSEGELLQRKLVGSLRRQRFPVSLCGCIIQKDKDSPPRHGVKFSKHVKFSALSSDK